MIDGSLNDVSKDAFPEQFYVEGMKWFTVNYQQAASTMMEVYKNYRKYRNSFYEFKPKYKGYDFIIPSNDINKTLNKITFSFK